MRLVLAVPERLPGTENSLGLGLPLTPEQHGFARTLKDRDGDDLQLLTTLRKIICPAGLSDEPVPGLSDAAPRQHEVNEFDDYFGIVREPDPGPSQFANSLLSGYRALLDEVERVGTRLTWAEWATLCGAFHAALCFPETTAVSLRPIIGRPRMLVSMAEPERRWLLGHHVFLVLIQGIVVGLNVYRYGRRSDDLRAAAVGLALAARMMAGSGSALIFATEFSPGQYATRIRPSIQEPNVSAGFSGLLAIDHRHLVRLLAELKPTFRNLPPQLRPAHRALASALADVYDAHKYVCAQFGGGRGRSLRMSPASTCTAVDVLQGLKMARSHSLGPV